MATNHGIQNDHRSGFSKGYPVLSIVIGIASCCQTRAAIAMPSATMETTISATWGRASTAGSSGRSSGVHASPSEARPDRSMTANTSVIQNRVCTTALMPLPTPMPTSSVVDASFSHAAATVTMITIGTTIGRTIPTMRRQSG